MIVKKLKTPTYKSMIDIIDDMDYKEFMMSNSLHIYCTMNDDTYNRICCDITNKYLDSEHKYPIFYDEDTLYDMNNSYTNKLGFKFLFFVNNGLNENEVGFYLSY